MNFVAIERKLFLEILVGLYMQLKWRDKKVIQSFDKETSWNRALGGPKL
jgi:hypothetical protein